MSVSERSVERSDDDGCPKIHSEPSARFQFGRSGKLPFLFEESKGKGSRGEGRCHYPCRKDHEVRIGRDQRVLV